MAVKESWSHLEEIWWGRLGCRGLWYLRVHMQQVPTVPRGEAPKTHHLPLSKKQTAYNLDRSNKNQNKTELKKLPHPETKSEKDQSDMTGKNGSHQKSPRWFKREMFQAATAEKRSVVFPYSAANGLSIHLSLLIQCTAGQRSLKLIVKLNGSLGIHPLPQSKRLHHTCLFLCQRVCFMHTYTHT